MLTGQDALHEPYDTIKENGERLPNTGEDCGETGANTPNPSVHQSISPSLLCAP